MQCCEQQEWAAGLPVLDSHHPALFLVNILGLFLFFFFPQRKLLWRKHTSLTNFLTRWQSHFFQLVLPKDILCPQERKPSDLDLMSGRVWWAGRRGGGHRGWRGPCCPRDTWPEIAGQGGLGSMSWRGDGVVEAEGWGG